MDTSFAAFNKFLTRSKVAIEVVFIVTILHALHLWDHGEVYSEGRRVSASVSLLYEPLSIMRTHIIRKLLRHLYHENSM